MTISKHAYKRAKERLGLNKKAFSRIVNKSIDSLTPRTELKGYMRRWVDNIYFLYENKHEYYVFNQYLFVVGNDVLITIYHLPKRGSKK